MLFNVKYWSSTPIKANLDCSLSLRKFPTTFIALKQCTKAFKWENYDWSGILFRKLCSCAFQKTFIYSSNAVVENKRMKNPLRHNNKVCFYYFSCFCCYHNFLFEVHRKSEIFFIEFSLNFISFFTAGLLQPRCTWSHIFLFAAIERYTRSAFAIFPLISI